MQAEDVGFAKARIQADPDASQNHALLKSTVEEFLVKALVVLMVVIGHIRKLNACNCRTSKSMSAIMLCTCVYGVCDDVYIVSVETSTTR